MLTLARARGISVFDAFSMGVVSIPITVIAGLAHSRWGAEPEPISETPSSSPESARTRSVNTHVIQPEQAQQRHQWRMT